MASGARLLVVGGGLAGAAAAWLATRAGHGVTVVSIDRPASQATSLEPGIVHGVGPSGTLLQWSRMPDSVLRASAERTRRGYALLTEALFGAHRSCGLRRCPHVVLAPHTLDRTSLGAVVDRLDAAGFSLRLEETGGQLVLVRAHDAILEPRRLTFELLRAAAREGARIELGRAFGRVLRNESHKVDVELAGGVEEYSGLILATGRPLAGVAGQERCRATVVLHQTLQPGLQPLEAILEAGDGEALLVPGPGSPGTVVLVRRAEETAGGGLLWPEAPPAWNLYRGPALRQRLAESHVCSQPGTPGRLEGCCSLAGLAGTSVAAVLGAADEAVSILTAV